MPIDATVGGATADSFIEVAEADTLLENNKQFVVWDALTIPEKEAYLKEATVYMCCVYRWFGRIYSAEQALCFPRTKLYDRDGRVIAAGIIPDPVKRAQALYALQFSLSTQSLFLLESQGAAQIKRVESGNIEVETGDTQSDFDAVLGVKRYPWIEALLLSMGAILGQGDLDDRTLCPAGF